MEEDDAEGGAGGIYRCDIDDPDVSNAIGSSVRPELKMLARVSASIYLLNYKTTKFDAFSVDIAQ